MKHATYIHLHLFDHLTLPEAADTQLTMDINFETFIERVPIEDSRDPTTVIATSLLIDFVQNLVPRNGTAFWKRFPEDARAKDRSVVENFDEERSVSFRSRGYRRKIQCFWRLLNDSDPSSEPIKSSARRTVLSPQM